MTGIQRTAIAIAVIAAGSLAGCTDDAASPDTSPSRSETTTPMPATSNSDPEKKPSTSSTTSTTSVSNPSGASSQHTVVRTDGGSIEVRGDGDVLEVVDITTAEGWEVQVERPDDRRLVAAFTGGGGRSEVTIVLTDQGIQTSTRATS